MAERTTLGYAYKCPVCGKEFATFYPKEWAYKIKGKDGKELVCSYTCMRSVSKRR